MHKPSALRIAATTLPAIGLSLELVNYALGKKTAFHDIPRSAIDNRFMDLKIWTANGADCEIPIQLIRPDRHCAISNYVFDYPKLPLHVIRLLGIQSNHNIVIGVALGLTAIIFAWLLLGKTFPTEKKDRLTNTAILAFASLVVFNSYQMKLLIERGQLDSLLLIIVLAPFLIASYRGLNRLNSDWLLPLYLTSSFIKPLMLAPALAVAVDVIYGSLSRAAQALRSRTQARQKLFIEVARSLAVIIGFTATYALLRSDIHVASRYLADTITGGKIGFGLTTLDNAAYGDWDLSLHSKLLFTALGFLIVTKTKPHKQYISFTRVNELAWQRQLYIISAAIILPTYFLTDSYSYKMVFIIGMLPALSIDYCQGGYIQRIQARLALSLIAISFLYGLTKYSDSQYAYSEWFVHFLVHPLMIGVVSGITATYLLTNTRKQQVVNS